MNLIITSAGRRNHLIDCFRTDATSLGISLRVLAADYHPESSPACLQADARFAVPHCSDPEFVPRLVEICRENDVSLLVPTIDPELLVLSQHQKDFATIGTRVAVSTPEVVALCQDKQATAACLAAAGIMTPKTVSLAAYLQDPTQLRTLVVAKPKNGSASFGIVRPKDPRELSGLDPERYIVQELWQGREFTVNVFFDRAGVLRCAVPHERLEVRAGEVSKGVTRHVPMLEDAARKLSSALPGAFGPLCFQAILAESGEAAVFEVNARFGGGFPLAHRAGAHFSRWLLEDAGGLPLSANNDWKAGVTMLRYDAAVFLEA